MEPKFAKKKKTSKKPGLIFFLLIICISELRRKKSEENCIAMSSGVFLEEAFTFKKCIEKSGKNVLSKKPANKNINMNFLAKLDQIYLNTNMLKSTLDDYQMRSAREKGSGKAKRKDGGGDGEISALITSRDENEKTFDEKTEDVSSKALELSFPFDERTSKSQMIRGHVNPKMMGLGRQYAD